MAFHSEINPLQILVILDEMSREAAIKREKMKETLLQ
jgi:hypothetical protein